MVFIHLVISQLNHAGILLVGCLVDHTFLGARLLGLVVCVSISMPFAKLPKEIRSPGARWILTVETTIFRFAPEG